MLNYLQRKFIELRLRSTKSSSNYWYPLAVPSYGSEEIIESLDSLINMQTTMGLKTLEFEKELNCQCVNYRIDSNLKLPGKNEFMDFNYKDEVLNQYDNLFPQYTDVIGLKSPN